MKIALFAVLTIYVCSSLQLPDEFIEKINAVTLDELDERGLIIWEEDVKSGATIWSKSPTTERVVNIIWTKEEWWREGFDTASVFRVIDAEHERSLTKPSEFVIEAIGVKATPLACPLNKYLHEHGCYSASD